MSNGAKYGEQGRRTELVSDVSQSWPAIIYEEK